MPILIAAIKQSVSVCGPLSHDRMPTTLNDLAVTMINITF